MVTVLPLAGPWNWLASACFTLAALFSDLLLLRLALALANLFLLIAMATGFGTWDDPLGTGGVSVDGIVWAALNLCLHGLGFLRLMYDERPIAFKSADEEQMWRLFYRRGGMERLEMLQVLKHGRFRRVAAGEQVPTSCMYLILDGLLQLNVHVPSAASTLPPQHARALVATGVFHLISGDFFDLRLSNIFGVYTGFLEEPGEVRSVFSLTDALLYEWTPQELNAMAVYCSPVVGSYWRNVLLCSVAREFRRQTNPKALLVCSRDLPEPPEVTTASLSLISQYKPPSGWL